MLDLGQPLALGGPGMRVNGNLVGGQDQLVLGHFLVLRDRRVCRERRQAFLGEVVGVEVQVTRLGEFGVRRIRQIGRAVYILGDIGALRALGVQIALALGLGLARGPGLLPVPVDAGLVVENDAVTGNIDLRLVEAVIGLGVLVVPDTVLLHVLEAAGFLHAGRHLAGLADEVFLARIVELEA